VPGLCQWTRRKSWIRMGPQRRRRHSRDINRNKKHVVLPQDREIRNLVRGSGQAFHEPGFTDSCVCAPLITHNLMTQNEEKPDRTRYTPKRKAISIDASLVAHRCAAFPTEIIHHGILPFACITCLETVDRFSSKRTNLKATSFRSDRGS